MTYAWVMIKFTPRQCLLLMQAVYDIALACEVLLRHRNDCTQMLHQHILALLEGPVVRLARQKAQECDCKGRTSTWEAWTYSDRDCLRFALGFVMEQDESS